MATHVGFVSTYPPTQCGLATFTSALRGAILKSGAESGPVVRLVESRSPAATPEIGTELVSGDRDSLLRAAARLNRCDAAIFQHEYGVYGGADGEEILDLLDQTTVPRIVVLHTVLTTPSAHQKQILEAVVAKADAVVTMTLSARERLSGYDVDMAKVNVIAHGASETDASKLAPTFRTGQFCILTWGLLGPGKGIEWGIEALTHLRDLHPAARYVVAGQTHPKVLLREGEAYRERLRAQARDADLGASVTFDGRYRTAPELAELVATADVVLLPYDSTEQVTSGVLIDAVAAGKPVIATEFPHARELLAGGAGILVPHRDPVAIAAALRSVMTEPSVAAKMALAAQVAAPHLRWPAIAAEYRALVDQLISARVAA